MITLHTRAREQKAAGKIYVVEKTKKWDLSKTAIIICLPRIDTRRLLVAWQNNVFALFLAEDKINQETIDLMRSWQHSGFSVDNSVYLSPRDTAGLECPECGGAMKIISFIERRQTNVIQQILRHCGLWQVFHAAINPDAISVRATGILKALRSPNPCKIIRIRARSVAI